MSAPGRSSVVVCRGSPQVELRGCEICAGSLALCLEVDGPRCEAVLADNRIEVEDAGAAAVSLWRAEQSPGSTVVLELENNDIRAGRTLALRDLTAGVTVRARDNRFTFQDALLSLTGFAKSPGWRRTVTWQGRNNSYRAAGEWLQMDGLGAGIGRPEDWEVLWKG